MLRIIIWIASLITAMIGAAEAEDGIASHYDRSSGSKVACGGALDEFRAYCCTQDAALRSSCPCREQAERTLGYRHDQRSWAVCRLSHHRPDAGRGACLGFQRARARIGQARVTADLERVRVSKPCPMSG